MTTMHCLSTKLGAIALAACVAASVPSAHAQSYSVKELGALPGKKESFPAAINASGQVAGTSNAGSSSDAAFLYDENRKTPMQDIGGVPFDSITRGFGINSSGEVVGDSTFGGKETFRHAAMFVKGTVADLGTMKEMGACSRATGINASEQVVGFGGADLSGVATRAFIWSASMGMVDLGTLGGTYAKALAINDSGFVTGSAQTAFGTVDQSHAFIYQPFPITDGPQKEMVDLGTLGGNSSYGISINAKNHVVGYSSINANDNFHAFLHDGEKMYDLGSLCGKSPDVDHSVALGVNNADQVVGHSFIPFQMDGSRKTRRVQGPAQQVAFVYTNGAMRNLNELIGGAAKTYVLYSATAINDQGQIVASAFDCSNGAYRAVLLTPAKSPSGLK